MLNVYYPFYSLLIPIVGVVGLAFSYIIFSKVGSQPEGNDAMKDIAEKIRVGAQTFLKKESQYLIAYAAVVFVLLWISLGFHVGLAFLLGAGCSLGASFYGMWAATMANVRTAQAAVENNPKKALGVAFDGGAVMGFAVASLGLLGLGLLLWTFDFHHLEQPMAGFGVGATSVALFARIGGGIYTKAADVGADLVGKVEAGIPEDDPRNPGVIADNVGDNVGDVAGMGADIYESYVNSIVSCATIGAILVGPALREVSTITDGEAPLAFQKMLLITPFVLAILGLISSYVSMLFLKAQADGEPGTILRNTMMVAAGGFLALSLLFFILFLPGVAYKLWFCVLFGTLCGVAIGLIAEYYTASKPVYEIAEASKTGPATNLISGLAVGLRSVVAPLWVMAVAIFVANYFGGVYGVSLAAVGMLATTCIVMTVDAYGPIADNAGGISEMSHQGPEVRAITDKLDAAGNTTAAIGKGFAVCSATLTAISIFGAYAQTVVNKMSGSDAKLDLSLTNPNLMIGALIGASLAGIVACLTMTAVGRAAGKMVDEIRRQFREIAGLLEGKPEAKPDVQRCVEISTKAALSEMMLPGVASIVIPVLVGFILGPDALGGLLVGALLVSVVLALFMANAGGAWDNAKKFIEQGKIPGEKKGSDAHKAAVVGDTVGDPFKDTSGPSLNILIKLVSMVALLIAPLIA